MLAPSEFDDNNLEPDPGCLDEDELDASMQDSSGTPAGDAGGSSTMFECRIEELQNTKELIKLIQNAKLGDTHCRLGSKFVSHIQNPPTEPLVLDDADLHLSLNVYLATINASQEAYKQV